MNPHLLIVEDDPTIGPQLASGLRKKGFETTLAADGLRARQWVARRDFDLIVLDLMLPEEDGFSLLKAWKHRTNTPIIVLTAMTTLEDRLRSFELGAVDWLPKPFYLEELIIRVRARLGQLEKPPAQRCLEVGGWQINLDARSVTSPTSSVELTAHEFNVLEVFITHPGRVFTRAQMADLALPDGGEREERTVDSYVYRLRRKLGKPFAALLKTVVSVGYRLDEPR